MTLTLPNQLFKHARHLAVIPLLVALTRPAYSAEFYYDALGRQVSSARAAAQTEVWTMDAADNRASLDAFLTQGPSSSSPDHLYQAEGLIQGQTVTSANGQYTLVMQQDGNLVEYQGSNLLWSTGTNQTTTTFAFMQGDGNFVLTDAQLNHVWSTGTNNHSGAYLMVENNGSIGIFQNGSVIWCSNNSC